MKKLYFQFCIISITILLHQNNMAAVSSRSLPRIPKNTRIPTKPFSHINITNIARSKWNPTKSLHTLPPSKILASQLLLQKKTYYNNTISPLQQQLPLSISTNPTQNFQPNPQFDYPYSLADLKKILNVTAEAYSTQTLDDNPVFLTQQELDTAKQLIATFPQLPQDEQSLTILDTLSRQTTEALQEALAEKNKEKIILLRTAMRLLHDLTVKRQLNLDAFAKNDIRLPEFSTTTANQWRQFAHNDKHSFDINYKNYIKHKRKMKANWPAERAKYTNNEINKIKQDIMHYLNQYNDTINEHRYNDYKIISKINIEKVKDSLENLIKNAYFDEIQADNWFTIIIALSEFTTKLYWEILDIDTNLKEIENKIKQKWWFQDKTNLQNNFNTLKNNKIEKQLEKNKLEELFQFMSSIRTNGTYSPKVEEKWG